MKKLLLLCIASLSSTHVNATSGTTPVTPRREPSWQDNQTSIACSLLLGILAEEYGKNDQMSSHVHKMLGAVLLCSLFTIDPSGCDGQNGEVRQLGKIESWLRAISMHSVAYAAAFLAKGLSGRIVKQLASLDRTVSPSFAMALIAAAGGFGYWSYAKAHSQQVVQ